MSSILALKCSNKKRRNRRSNALLPKMLFVPFFLFVHFFTPMASSFSPMAFLPRFEQFSTRMGHRPIFSQFRQRTERKSFARIENAAGEWFSMLKRNSPSLPSAESQCSAERLLQSPALIDAAIQLLMDKNGSSSALMAPSKGMDSMRQGFVEPEAMMDCQQQSEMWAQKMADGNAGGDELAPGMPIGMRALCPFVAVENVDQRRLPTKITEVKCICDRPASLSANANAEGSLRCEPLQMDIPVLLLDAECRQFQKVMQRITVGCMAVHSPASRSDFASQIGQLQQMSPQAMNI